MNSIHEAHISCLPQIDIIGSPITALPFERQISEISNWSQRALSKVVCVANAHMLVESFNDQELCSILKSADLVTPDGMPLVWMMRVLGIRTQERVAGLDLFLALCQAAADYGVSIFLVGSTQSVLDKMVQKLAEDFPELRIAGAESPPFRPLTSAEDAGLVDRINSSGAGITFVAFGCPKQEKWMGHHRDAVQSVMIGVGGVFPVYAGLKRRAPKWVCDNGLEWLYRLMQEPRRLYRRYLRTNPQFIALAFAQIGQQYFLAKDIQERSGFSRLVSFIQACWEGRKSAQ